MGRQLDDRDDSSTCTDCGATMFEGDQSFASSADTYLCFACAERRGGVYDGARDRWTVPPDVTGLPDERRPHP